MVYPERNPSWREPAKAPSQLMIEREVARFATSRAMVRTDLPA